MQLRFLSDEWFAEYDRLADNVEMPEKLEGVVVNLRINRHDGDALEARIDGGFLRRGFSPAAVATITAPEDIMFTALVLGDVKDAMPAIFNGKLKIEGDKLPLVRLGMVPPTASQSAMTERLQAMTTVDR